MNLKFEKYSTFFIVYSVRRLITGVPSNSLRGFYKTLYNRIFKDQTHKSHYFDSILSFFMQLNTKDRVPTDDEFKNSLINGNLYQKKNLCKMLLTAIENNNSNETLDVKTLTIEHILPQTLNEVWLHELGENAEDIWSKYVHTLGNLTITGYNSELGQKSFNDKKCIIKNHSKANKLNESIISASNWSLEEIINRAMKLADRLLEIFHIDNAENVIDYEVNNGNSYSLIEKEKIGLYKTG